MLSIRKLGRPVAAVVTLALVAGCSGGSSGRGASASTSPGATVTPTATGTGAAVATPAATTPPPPPAPAFTFGTRKAWPLVLVHGICGWKQIGSVDYFYGVPKVLRDQGFEVLVTEAPPIGLVAERAQKVVDQILAAYPDPRVKVNIVAHSMGGLDARHAITSLGLGPRVASLTTVGTPHRGAVLCDVSTALVPSAFATSSIAFLGSIGIDIRGAFELTTTNIQQSFNPRTPDDPRVAYFSWAGAGTPTSTAAAGKIEPALVPTWWMIDAHDGPNDGIVAVSSAKWGNFRGTLPSDHFGEIGQPLGVNGFDHKRFYEDWAIELEGRGFGP